MVPSSLTRGIVNLITQSAWKNRVIRIRRVLISFIYLFIIIKFVWRYLRIRCSSIKILMNHLKELWFTLNRREWREKLWAVDWWRLKRSTKDLWNHENELYISKRRRYVSKIVIIFNLICWIVPAFNYGFLISIN